MRDAKGKNYICSEEGKHRQSNTRRLPAAEAGNRDDSLAVWTIPTVLSLQQSVLREKEFIPPTIQKILHLPLSPPMVQIVNLL